MASKMNRGAQPTAPSTDSISCAACGRGHLVIAGTWVSLASGDTVCRNDTCWRVMVKWYKERNDAEKMDEGTTRGSEPQGDGVLGEDQS